MLLFLCTCSYVSFPVQVRLVFFFTGSVWPGDLALLDTVVRRWEPSAVIGSPWGSGRVVGTWCEVCMRECVFLGWVAALRSVQKYW